MKTLDQYTIKAVDSYPYDLENTIESLEYALSYNRDNALALWIYGKVYTYEIPNHELAKSYYIEAMSADLKAVYIYPDYIKLLIDMEEYDEAKKLISFALKMKGSDKPEILSTQVTMYEKLRKFSKAKKCLDELEMSVLDDEYQSMIQSTRDRIEKKIQKK